MKLEEILELYKKAYEGSIEDDLKYLSEINSDILIKKMNITYDTIQKLQFNVNIGLLLDKFAIEMEKCNE